MEVGEVKGVGRGWSGENRGMGLGVGGRGRGDVGG